MIPCHVANTACTEARTCAHGMLAWCHQCGFGVPGVDAAEAGTVFHCSPCHSPVPALVTSHHH